MNKTFYKIFSLSAVLLTASILLMQGCSKQADNLVVSTSEVESCSSSCHGNANHTYPPNSLAGNTLPTQKGVGAHEVHLNPDSTVRFSAQVSCGECHIPVNNYYDSSHIGPNPGTAKVVFGTLAKTVTTGFTPNPVWDATSQTCSNTYCHGYFKGGNSAAQPIFNNPNSVVCGSCHGDATTGNPKPLTGHQYYPDQCWYCHGAVVDTNRVIKNKFKHINGVVDYNVGD